MPPLITERLVIRPFTMDDLEDIHRILDLELERLPDVEPAASKEDRQAWLAWTVRSYKQLARLYQPPYGDRAIVLRTDGRLIGSCGLVPSLGPFGRLSSFGSIDSPEQLLMTPEVGLYYAVSPAFQGQGYATEAAGALVAFGFGSMALKRIIATTTHNNAASIAVMCHLGMTIERNPSSEPPWFQAVGVLHNPTAHADPVE
jgi:RimJ/RimL family protein N-acetyltransferase